MLAKQPTILALDFDGVVCDGLIEYFQTAWQAYCQLWSPSDTTPPEGMAPSFYRLRPVVETGWEMPVLIRSLLLGIPEPEILAHWESIAPKQAQEAGLTSTEIAAMVDRVRDEWIAKDLDHWLAQHRFYPGVIERLQQTLTQPVYPVIITTKEGRFVRQLLHQQHVDLPESQIFGKEVRQPKAQTLRNLFQQFSQKTTGAVEIWFVEDRLKTLQAIQAQPELNAVQLFLAAWGYNTSVEREAVGQENSQIHLLSLPKFSQAFSEWY
jgi:phosphoglycolate phosphatase-like HAD superfamily hydrolase